jgi:hypothetical protein
MFKITHLQYQRDLLRFIFHLMLDLKSLMMRLLTEYNQELHYWIAYKSRRGRDHMVVGITTTCAISAYHILSCEFEPRSWRGVLDTVLCDNVCQWLATGRWFSPGTLVSSTNKTITSQANIELFTKSFLHIFLVFLWFN